MSNITQIPMSPEALDRILADIGVIPDSRSKTIERLRTNEALEEENKNQHELLVLIYEELENYGHVTPKTYSAIVKQIGGDNE